MGVSPFVSVDRLSVGARYFVCRTGAAGTCSGLGFGSLAPAGGRSDVIAGATENSLQILRMAFGASHLDPFFLIHHQKFEAFVAFQAFEFIYRHNRFLIDMKI